jgi:molecular chaperone DnaK (HSP70)
MPPYLLAIDFGTTNSAAARFDPTTGQGKTLLAALPFAPHEIEQLVITVPVAAFESYTAWLSRALHTLPAARLKIIDESTAAALGYAVTEPGSLVLVIDFGGGTLALSLVRLPDPRTTPGKVLFTSETHLNHNPKATVIAKAGATLGGRTLTHGFSPKSSAAQK